MAGPLHWTHHRGSATSACLSQHSRFTRECHKEGNASSLSLSNTHTHTHTHTHTPHYLLFGLRRRPRSELLFRYPLPTKHGTYKTGWTLGRRLWTRGIVVSRRRHVFQPSLTPLFSHPSRVPLSWPSRVAPLRRPQPLSPPRLLVRQSSRERQACARRLGGVEIHVRVITRGIHTQTHTHTDTHTNTQR